MGSLTNITDAAQLAAIADENRMTILRLLMAGPATLTQLAVALGSYAARVRHHVKRLEDVGLIRLARSVTTRNYTEKFYEATAAAYTVHLMVVPERGEANPLVILHCDAALEALVGMAERGGEAHEYSTVTTGSLDGLVSLRLGLADIAGCHLLDVDTQEYNTPFVKHLFPGRPMTLVTMAHREQGLIVTAGNPMGLHDVSDLAQPGIRLVNREPGSGTRTWLDGRLRQLGIDASSIDGYHTIAETHASVAEAVASGAAHAGIAPRAAAVAAGLDFVPLFMERYDLVMDKERADDPRVDRLLDALCARPFRKQADSHLGYDTSRTGDVTATI